jgi:transposase
VKAARDAWFARFADVRVDRLAFLDEFGANTQMQRTHGRAAPGERVVSKVPHGHWKSISTIAVITAGGVLTSASFDGATDADLFLVFVREAVAPALEPGQVLVLDNLPAHRSPAIDRAVAAAGATLVRLPPYSPDFNPIEMAISKAKTVLRKLARRTVDGLMSGIGEALATISPADSLSYIAHCGYATNRCNPL